MLDRTIAPPIRSSVDFHLDLPDCHKTVFENNIPLYWLNAGTQEIIQLEWVFKAGLWEEDKTSVARATAAQIKNGTRSNAAHVISESIEFYGASLQSTAENDYSTITLHCLAKHLNKLLPLIREVILHPIFPEDELAIFKQKASHHLAVNLKKVDFVANREGDRLVFGYDHPYGRYSRMEDIENLNVTDLRDFHKQYYTAANCKLFMAGRINEATVEEVNKNFGCTNWGEMEVAPTSKQHQFQPIKKRKLKIAVKEKSVQGAIRLLRHFPDLHHPDFPPMMILNTLLGGYFGSRLMTNIREEKGYTYGIHSMVYTYREGSVFTIATEAGKEVCGAVIEETKKELNRLRNEAVSKEELSLVKNYLFGNLLGDMDGPFMLIRLWKSLILNDYDKERFYEKLQIYRSISPEQLQQLAQKYFNPKDFYELLVV